MIYRKCDKCQNELDPQNGYDLVAGELRVPLTNMGERGDCQLVIQTRDDNLQPTERDLCRQCLIEVLDIR